MLRLDIYFQTILWKVLPVYVPSVTSKGLDSHMASLTVGIAFFFNHSQLFKQTILYQIVKLKLFFNMLTSHLQGSHMSRYLCVSDFVGNLQSRCSYVFICNFHSTRSRISFRNYSYLHASPPLCHLLLSLPHLGYCSLHFETILQVCYSSPWFCFIEI